MLYKAKVCKQCSAPMFDEVCPYCWQQKQAIKKLQARAVAGSVEVEAAEYEGVSSPRTCATCAE